MGVVVEIMVGTGRLCTCFAQRCVLVFVDLGVGEDLQIPELSVRPARKWIIVQEQRLDMRIGRE